ncbi:MAG: tRNA-dihydrouridine synthase [Alphaproteobacteria bacterium]|nr:tRNA-dihydrouridine synthase [Alphaproteobacteria bacterium]
MTKRNECPIFSAPMAGVTDKPFRYILRRFGMQTLYTEMIGVNTLAYRHPSTCKMIHIADEKNIIVQLVGVDEDNMIKGAKEAEFNGAIGIDINMGCPVKKLISNGSGAALMKDIDKACRLVERVKESVSVPVSVKTRLGWDEQHITINEFVQKMSQTGVSHITIHGRTREQGYAGQANITAIEQVARQNLVPIIANGDITDRQSAENMCNKECFSGLMIGRGILGKPWLLQEIETKKKPSFCLSDIVLEHLDLMLHYYGKHGLYVARKHLAWYARGKKEVAQFCRNIYLEEDEKEVKRQIISFFTNAEEKE